MHMREVAIAVCVVLLGLACLPGCTPAKNAIAVSNKSLDFALNERPITIDVWNSNLAAGTIAVTAVPSAPWIVANAETLTCPPPSGSGVFNKQALDVSINRNLLAPGEYDGSIALKAKNVVTVNIAVHVIQPDTGQRGPLNIVNPVVRYEEPYLIDFSFVLENEAGDAVVAEPAQFAVTARENDLVAGEETGVHLRRGAARQLKVHLVLDYTASMQAVHGATAAMEEAATGVLLPALNEDALVGVTEFHRDDLPPARVSEFTVDRTALQERIASIQDTYVHGFYSGSRTWDAVLDTAETFEQGKALNEARYIILFSDGNDTSSVHSRNQAVDAVRQRDAHLYAVAFGENVNENALRDMATRTEGAYFPAGSLGELQDAFQHIVQNLGAQYSLRWASLRRNNVPVFPSFVITLGQNSASYAATQAFVATEHADSPEQALEGRLRVVASSGDGTATAFLRAEYVPRFIRSINLFVGTSLDYTVSTVEAANDGIMDGWAMNVVDDPAHGGKWIELETQYGPLDFASFGPMLRFDFSAVPDEGTPLFDAFYIENSIYTNGQSFIVEGFENTPPE